ncbi:NifB/NifX family molybdenum-iron cluster-binding protein [Clostridium sp. A1-XYC3]|uniref:NifB/NifX family molybdenum-iron cluster-binding protein n=1 Tax=Clostridium tanneri TaxID=3037988 RepID=A0ABU4JTT9_9CLOT|nr:NifB/NifX family molybdenum-iron cluster-binding protein [Clostridium sp. A1-XYC3]MDW8801575.1 NifB/NifX family molybdenum-iron cluster-binding protein [Clostridium sp. A1-XYC3]
MKVCVPVKENKGLDSVPFNHFGTAPLFLIYDSEKEELKAIQNGDLNHQHGMCQPMKALSGEEVDAILVGGIGAGAINKLTARGIKVYRAVNETVLKNIELLKKSELMEFSINNTCNHHDCEH